MFKFFMYKENLNFPEAVAYVANLAHIAMPSDYGTAAKPLSPLKQIQAEANSFFHHVLLTTKAGERALNYAKSRGLSEELLEHFQIGYAPNQGDILLKYLQGKGYPETDLIKSGLFVQSKDGRLFDRFRDRLMFPLSDESGQIVGFSGRRISDNPELAKYMNSPETEIFTKSKVLFHFPEAKKASRKEGHLVLYEGYMDVIAGYESGIKSGIASMGTSLTEEQIYMLRRVTPNIVLNYDGDAPGVHAMERATNLFEQIGGFNLGIVVLPENLDPDEYVKKYGVEKYRNEVENAVSPTDFLLQQLSKKYNLENDREKLAYIDDGIKLIAQLSDPVAQDIYLTKLSSQMNVSKDSLKVKFLRQQRRIKTANRHKRLLETDPEPPQPVVETDASIKPNLSRLLYLFIHSEEARNYLLQKQFLFPDKNYAKLAELWLNFYETHEDADVNSFLDFIPEQLQGIIVNMEMVEMPTEFTKREIDDYLQNLSKQEVVQQINQLLIQLQNAKSRNDQDEVLKITQQIIALKRKQL